MYVNSCIGSRANPALVSRRSKLRILVFSHNSNTSIDSADYKLSLARATERVEQGKASWLDGRSIRLKAPIEFASDRRNFVSGSGYDSAWSIKPSGGVPCWQLNT